MKKLYALLLLQIIWGGGNAQTINVCANYCSKDFRDSIPGIQVNTSPVRKSYAHEPATTYASDIAYPDDYNRCHDTPIGNVLCEDMAASLIYDVFYPVNHNYTSCKLPALILFHGGAYSECSDLTNPGIVKLAREFALRGFVVFNVEYRRGVLTEPETVPLERRVSPNVPQWPQGRRFTTVQQMLAIYRACQDARGAIRTIVQRENEGGGTDGWRVDVTRLFVGGISAGSVIALSSVFYQTPGQWDSVFPGGITSASRLGPVDRNDYYYAGAQTDFPLTSIRGVINCWGTLLAPATQQNWQNTYLFFSGNYIPPVISFHGLQDSTFNYDRQTLHFSPTHNIAGDIFRTENNCMSTAYTFPGGALDQQPDLIGFGSQRIYNMLKGLSVFTEFYLDCNMAHGLDEDCISCPPNGPLDKYRVNNQCVACVFDSDFGTGLPNSSLVLRYMAARAGTFFQRILAPGGVPVTMLSTDSKFVDCENKRHTCDPAEDNAGCCNEDNCTTNCRQPE